MVELEGKGVFNLGPGVIRVISAHSFAGLEGSHGPT